MATASTATALAVTTGTTTTAPAAPAQRDGGPQTYRVSVRAGGAWELPPGLTSFTVYVRGSGGGSGGGGSGGGGSGSGWSGGRDAAEGTTEGTISSGGPATAPG
ncbi:hypothetical protein DR950_31810 [Kitasatospora xanthocidica]|uniref:Uncharacterized protein n=1 Tax=Kitasatospora xanthocidica TaxID=83382 RepID=A0A373A228_9ACTN|nr:hypothetical protein DR950_31810 [Kitasatospora xanthocidica]